MSKRLELIERVCTALYSTRAYFHQCNEVISELEPSMNAMLVRHGAVVVTVIAIAPRPLALLVLRTQLVRPLTFSLQVSVQEARATEAEKTKQWDALRTTLHVDVSTAVASVVSALSGLPNAGPAPSTPMHASGKGAHAWDKPWGVASGCWVFGFLLRRGCAGVCTVSWLWSA
jgi:hypothetical protein